MLALTALRAAAVVVWGFAANFYCAALTWQLSLKLGGCLSYVKITPKPQGILFENSEFRDLHIFLRSFLRHLLVSEAHGQKVLTSKFISE